ncbi:MAG: phosphate signaling complex protein PhoU [Burkholderiales bacterium]|nr:phosphate signaling complex protein PhoU [Burkholderiales bacterium]
MHDKHLCTAFEAELATIGSHVRDMGALAEAMVRTAMAALLHANPEQAGEVLAMEQQVNASEVEIDHELSTALVRWQPAASDLRFLLAVSKVTSNLERVGDQAVRIARTVLRFNRQQFGDRADGPLVDISEEARTTLHLLRGALDAFDRRNAVQALAAIALDDGIEAEFDGLLRGLVAAMADDPRKIACSLDLVVVAKAIESIADHARNIAEEVVYLVRGVDVRHAKNAGEASALAGSA